jgi:hypothetical protein
MNDLSTDLNFYSSVGAANIRGKFVNLSQPGNCGIYGTGKNKCIRSWSIVRNDQLGDISGNVAVAGKGMSAND